MYLCIPYTAYLGIFTHYFNLGVSEKKQYKMSYGFWNHSFQWKLTNMKM